MSSAQSSREGRPYAVVLFGASGFTGKLVAEYLAGLKRADLRWALAGRSQSKLEEVRRHLTSIDPACAELPILTADSQDEAGLRAIARQARVICTTVGPYARYGLPLVRVCAEEGTDYCDLTGEVHFVRRSIDSAHAIAEATGARIVHSCGFDSLPSDLGVHLLAEHFAHKGQRLHRAKLYVLAMRGGASGGTIASGLDMITEASQDRELRRLLGDPYALYPDRSQDRGPDRSDQKGVELDAEAGYYTAPFVMAAINTRIVRRSNALLNFAYGRDFRYAEVVANPKTAAGLVRSAATAAFTAGMVLVGSSGTLRDLARKRLPTPGEGPSRAARERGFFVIRVLGHSDRGDRAECHIKGNHDPGYGETSRMLSEAALCLAEDALPARGGVLTPAVVMGSALVPRLRRAGMTWEVRDL
ncbi:MAG: saccharopine dehydrogenase NADP-binding domain-containing protein [Myxococcales bacterium]|nr:saccharopine dehydrogenase NADP-binding domain-containing protein [Myxococcales bacterium]